ncbi:lysyl-tRNA synthetase, class 2 [Geobacter sp. DSM 9736]|nr:lysyl-tRNA synthetase, class 2 [Geobacter sp. DSM 9736]
MKNWHLRRRAPALAARAQVIQEIRRFFIEGGFLEVETPLRIPAPAPESHIDPVTSEGWYLHTSPELCMKRLLAAGYQKIFQVCRCWRGGERGIRHLPEFTMLEWYRGMGDYRDLMKDCEGLIRRVAGSLKTGDTINIGETLVSLTSPWERLSVREAFLRHTNISMEQALDEDRFDELMISHIEPQLGIDKPVFLLDYPAERGALARLKSDDSTLAERFELYIAGIELANGFSELTDAQEQRARFLQAASEKESRGAPPSPMPERFLEELDLMPPSAGIALGLDRLVMVLLDKQTIDEVVAFTPEEL